MEPKKRADARRAALSRYAVQLYTMASEGKLKHSDMVQRAIDFAVVNARKDFPFSYKKGEHRATKQALDDLKYVFVGQGVRWRRAAGKHNVQKKLFIDFRRGATGFHESMVDNGDQINHTFGALLGAYYYHPVFQGMQQHLMEGEKQDRAVNRRAFYAGNQVDDSNLDSLGRTLRAMLEADKNIDLTEHKYTKAERGNIEPIIRHNISHKSWLLKNSRENGRRFGRNLQGWEFPLEGKTALERGRMAHRDRHDRPQFVGDVHNVLNRFGYRGLYDRRAVDAFAKEAYAKAFERQEARYRDGAARLYDEDGTFTRDTVHGVLTRLFAQKGILLPDAGSGTPSLARRRIESKRRNGVLTKDDVGDLIHSLR